MSHLTRQPRTTGHLEQIRRFASGELPPPPIAQLMGHVAKRVDVGQVVLERDADERHANQMGTIAGGIIADLCDAAIGTAMATTLEDDEDFTVIELTVKFVKGMRRARLRGSAAVIQRTTRLGFVECEVTDGVGNLVAMAYGTCLVGPSRTASPLPA